VPFRFCPRLQVVNPTSLLARIFFPEVGATDGIVFVFSRLTGTANVVLSFGCEPGRHVQLGRNGDGGKCGLSKLIRLNHFAGVSRPSNTLCLTWGPKSFPRTPPRPFVNASLRP
jgi:hypothetical protein